MPDWLDNKYGAWGVAIVLTALGGVVTYLKPAAGIPLLVILLSVGIYLIWRAYKTGRTTEMPSVVVDGPEVQQSDTRLMESLNNSRAGAESILVMPVNVDTTLSWSDGSRKLGEVAGLYGDTIERLGKLTGTYNAVHKTEINSLVISLQRGRSLIDRLRTEVLSAFKRELDANSKEVIRQIDDLLGFLLNPTSSTDLFPKASQGILPTVPELTISDLTRISGEQATFSCPPHGTLNANDIDLYRITVLNRCQDSEARDVRVGIADSKPNLSVLPVRLHKMHDNTPPYTQVWPLGYGESARFDFIGMERASKILLLYRSDLGGTGYVFAVPVSEAVALWKGGIIFRISVRATPPARGTDSYYRAFLDENEEFKVEPITTPEKEDPQT
jgi:hypothetical protein